MLYVGGTPIVLTIGLKELSGLCIFEAHKPPEEELLISLEFAFINKLIFLKIRAAGSAFN